MKMTGGRIVTAEQVDGAELDAFLRRFFSTDHCDFLLHHGAWWHRGQHNRLVALLGETIAGYSALIPAPCRVDGVRHQARWWVDLVVDPAFRGRGLQTLMDRKVRQAELLLGFPNALAARIHRKHGWGVCETHRTVLLPYDPTRLRPVLRATGLSGVALQTAARLARPLGRHLRRRAHRFRPIDARRLEKPTAEALGELFERHHRRSTTTTLRDTAYLKWRYFDAPYRRELSFFVAGSNRDRRAGAETTGRIAAITRSRQTHRGRVVGLLDLFGELEDRAATTDLIRLVARDAARENAVEVKALVTLRSLRPVFRAAGYRLRASARSCWLSSDPALMERIDPRDLHWAMADSDQEVPA